MRQANSINVTIQRLGESDITLNLPVDSTVAEALEEANLPVGIGCRVWTMTANSDDILDDGDVLVVATKKITQG